jgi:phosphate transport system substrate-binding protein
MPRLVWVTIAAVLVLFVVAAWSALSADRPPEGVAGSVFASGSSTVEPVTLIVAEKFHERDPSFSYQVEGPGTGDGFALFCNGETDVSNASRPIDPAEIETCQANGIRFAELLVANDGLSVITSSRNDAIDCLSFVDLYALLGPESQGIRRWSDAEPLARELTDAFGDRFGSATLPYPTSQLVVTAPGEESGTFDTFVEIVIGPIADERGTDHTTRPDYVASPNDNVILEGIAGTTSSLGWVGMAFAEEGEGLVRQLAVDGGAGCVLPSPEAVADGAYPIARPLFVYVNTGRAAESEALREFVEFYLSTAGLASAADVGYVPLTDDQAAASRAEWQAAMEDASR